MKFQILTINGWKDWKSLSEKTKFYTVKNNKIFIDCADRIDVAEDNLYSYNLDGFTRYACTRTKLMSNSGEISFIDTFNRFILDNKIFKVPLMQEFSVNIDGIEKTDEEIKESVSNKFASGWTKKLNFECTLKFIREWMLQNEKLFVESEKDASNIQIIMIKIGKLSSIEKDHNDRIYVNKVPQSGIADNCQLLFREQIKLPIKEGEVMHFFIRDENKVVTVF